MILSSETPIVSVITVCLNPIKNGRMASLRNCIEGVRSQTFPKIEHLIVDGGSNDGTLDLLTGYQKFPNLRIVSEPDKGIYDAMNKGIRLARGKYIVYINSDDAFSDSGAVAAVVTELEKTDADFSYADADVFSENHAEFLRRWTGTIDDIPYGYYPCHQTLFCKTSVLRKIGGFTEQYMANDNLLMLKLATRYRSVYVPRVIVNFHEGGASQAMIEAYQKMRDEVLDYFFREVGESAGLDRSDCDLLYERQCFKLQWKRAISIGARLPLVSWREHYFAQYCEFVHRHVVNEFEKSKDARIEFKLFGKFKVLSI